MQLELVASWSCTPDREFQHQWLKVVPGMVGVFLGDGSLTVRRPVAGAPVVASLSLPANAQLALDPRGEVVACLDGGRLSLLGMTGAEVAAVQVPHEISLELLCFRLDGERLWLFGFVDSTFRALAYDRALALVGDYRPPLTLSPAGWPIQVHPSEDAFVLTLSEDQDDPQAGARRVGVRIVQGEATIVFDEGDIDYPCLGFTQDGRFLIGLDPFTRLMAFSWPTYAPGEEASFEPDHEGRPVGMIVGDHLVTERHSKAEIVYDPKTQTAEARETHDSALWILALPTLEEKALIPWVGRGFGDAQDDAGLEIVDAVSSDSFLESRRNDDGSFAMRIWRLVDRK